jgi:hypothetical protein
MIAHGVEEYSQVAQKQTKTPAGSGWALLLVVARCYWVGRGRGHLSREANILGGKASIKSTFILWVQLFTPSDSPLLIKDTLLSRETGSNDNKGDDERKDDHRVHPKWDILTIGLMIRH